jgi:hypothetical protein
MEKKDRNIEEMNAERWITNLAFLVDVTGHLTNLNKELQGKDKLITDMYNNTKAFRVKLRLWENQLKVPNLVHFPQLKSLDTIFPKRIQKYSLSLSLSLSLSFLPLREEFDERFKDFRIMGTRICVCLTLKGRRRECSRKSANEINQFTIRY